MGQAETLLAEALGIEPAATQAARLGVDPWTSLAHLRLVLALEEHLARALSPEEMFELASLTQVQALLARSGSRQS